MSKVELSEFFTEIIVDLTTQLKDYYKEGNAHYRVKEHKDLEATLTPFLEKSISC